MKKSSLLFLALLPLTIFTGCVTQTESFTYDPALGPAYDTVKPEKIKRDGVYYTREGNYSGGNPGSVTSHFY